MVAVKSGDSERVLRQRSPDRHPVLLLYGPDQGLISERARAAAEAAVDDPADPFQLIRLDGDAVATEPGRLAEEAGTIGLFGNRRSVWVRRTARNLAPAVTACLDLDLTGTNIVIEAGDLARSAPLRTLCEKSERALAVPCHADRARELADMLDGMLREAGLTMGRPEKEYLLQSLGGDRLASRGEILKLILYAHGKSEITAGDIEAVVSDVAGGALDGVIDAAFAGRLADADDGWLRQARNAPAQLLGAASRHALALLAARAELSAGRGLDETVGRWRGLHFTRKGVVTHQLEIWSEPDLETAAAKLQVAVLDTRRHAALAGAIAGRALLDIARQAAARSRRR